MEPTQTFDYIREIIREQNLENPNTGSIEEIKQRLAYCKDKVNNINRIKSLNSKNTFGCIEARENLQDPGMLLTIIDADIEMYIKINKHQSTKVLLTKACERFNKNPENYNLVYNNSTLHKHYMAEIIFQRFQAESFPNTVFIFKKNDHGII